MLLRPIGLVVEARQALAPLGASETAPVVECSVGHIGIVVAGKVAAVVVAAANWGIAVAAGQDIAGVDQAAGCCSVQLG